MRKLRDQLGGSAAVFQRGLELLRKQILCWPERVPVSVATTLEPVLFQSAGPLTTRAFQHPRRMSLRLSPHLLNRRLSPDRAHSAPETRSKSGDDRFPLLALH